MSEAVVIVPKDAQAQRDYAAFAPVFCHLARVRCVIFAQSWPHPLRFLPDGSGIALVSLGNPGRAKQGGWYVAH